MKQRILSIIPALLLLLGVLSSCDRHRQIPVPYVYVNYTVYLNNPSNYPLQVPGNYLILPDLGNHGIILYRRTIGEPDDFVAFDLTCTNEPLDECVLSMDSTGFYLECPCCGSRFSVWDGMVAKGPSRWPLLQYQTAYNGTTVRIYN